jgi:H+/Cl- antiporter ClcA
VGLSLLAVLAGLVTGAVAIAFRLVTEHMLVWLSILPQVERYESLAWEWRLGLPTAGGILIGLLFQLAPHAARAVGPVHVMAQLAHEGGRLPWRNAMMQFVGGAVSIISGHSVGREGPVIHIGAACASLLGQGMRLPNNSIRILVACGVAASIAASFNTPLAGVVFSMEVMMFEYTLAGFTPVILSAVAAASLSRVVFGPNPAFSTQGLELVSLLELPWILLVGVLVGSLAAAYVCGIRRLDRRSMRLSPWLRMSAAGAFTGLLALVAPEVMGLGYDTVQASMLGEIGLLALVAIAAAKLAATVVCCGLGLPGGLIGPMIVIGATAGGALGVAGHAMWPESSAAPAFYAVVGAAAMMGAALHAPLAALMAVLELTANPGIILPGMAAVVTAFLISRVVFRQEPLFVSILRTRGTHYGFDPVELAMERIGVAAVMSRRPLFIDAAARLQDMALSPENSSSWVVLVRGDEVLGVMSSAMLSEKAAEPSGDLRVGDGMRALLPTLVSVPVHATLGEALNRLDEASADVALVSAFAAPQRHEVEGVIDRMQIESSVRHRK